MKLHVKTCVYCKRCLFRVDGESNWRANLQEFASQHEEIEILSNLEIACGACNQQIIHDLSVTAGAVH